MTDPNFIILYVDSPAISTQFYTELLGKPPIEASPTFALFTLESGVMLGLWARDTVEPTATGSVGGGKLAFSIADNESVNLMYSD